MYVLVAYDVNTEDKAGRGRLRRVAKECVNYGQRVQNSVFECLLDPAQLKILEKKLADIIDVNKDSIRFYHIGNNYKDRIWSIGVKTSYDIEGFLDI